MNYFIKQYKATCKKEFHKYGFKSYHNNYYRVVNDVFQSFCLQRSVSGMDCTVNFSLVPLCSSHEINKLSCNEGGHLKMFEGSYAWFPYDRHSEESMRSCIHSMVDYIHKYLIPYFEKGNSCKNAYAVISEFEAMSKPQTVELPVAHEFPLYSHLKFCIALKNGDYILAVNHLEEIKIQWQYAYQHTIKVWKELQYKIDAEYERKMEADMTKLQKQIELISKRDMDYINNFIQSNEQRSLRNLGLAATIKP